MRSIRSPPPIVHRLTMGRPVHRHRRAQADHFGFPHAVYPSALRLFRHPRKYYLPVPTTTFDDRSKSSGLPHISTHTSDHNIDATRSTSTGRRDYVPSSRSIPAPAGRHRSAAGKRAHRGRGRRQAPAAPRSEPHRATSIRPEPLPGQRHSLPTPSRG